MAKLMSHDSSEVLVFKKHFLLLSVMKMVALRNVLVEIMILFSDLNKSPEFWLHLRIERYIHTTGMFIMVMFVSLKS